MLLPTCLKEQLEGTAGSRERERKKKKRKGKHSIGGIVSWFQRFPGEFSSTHLESSKEKKEQLKEDLRDKTCALHIDLNCLTHESVSRMQLQQVDTAHASDLIG